VKKTSIYLEPELDRALARHAAAQGISKAEAVRRAVAAAVANTPRPRIQAIGVIEGPGDVAENIERYLAEGDFGRE
jgi:Ribbon-helix-helix protein, copG family